MQKEALMSGAFLRYPPFQCLKNATATLQKEVAVDESVDWVYRSVDFQLREEVATLTDRVFV